MAAKSITIARDAAAAIASIEADAASAGGSVEQLPLQNGTRLRIALDGATHGLNVYPSKGGGAKLVFDNPETDYANHVAALLESRPSTPKARKAASGALKPVLADASCWIGSDESGKGDYFGPLVVAAVAATADNWRVLETLGVQDSKNLTDSRAAALADEIRGAFPSEVIVIMPKRYNELWASMGSVNRLLAWAHARAIENVAEKAPDAVAAVADQFGDESLIRKALFDRGRELELVQMPRAERDPAVAAASILARAEFLRRLAQLSERAGTRLPKGASAAVENAARALVAGNGPGILDEMAKKHFRTTGRVL